MEHKIDLDSELMTITVTTCARCLTHPNGADALALYMFYYLTARRQETLQPKASQAYCRRGLNWGKARYQNAKKALAELGLVDEIVRKDENTGRITGWYVRLKYVPLAGLPTGANTQGVENPPGGDRGTNTKRHEDKYSEIGHGSTLDPSAKPARQPKEEDPRVEAFITKWLDWGKRGWVTALQQRNPPTAMEIDSRKRLAAAVKNPNFDVGRMAELIPGATALHRFRPTLLAFLGKNKKGEVIWERLLYGDNYVWGDDRLGAATPDEQHIRNYYAGLRRAHDQELTDADRDWMRAEDERRAKQLGISLLELVKREEEQRESRRRAEEDDEQW